ncbi:hypothetical protein Poli38472_006135 [Pythium oligandrum]|uniref:Aspartate aminotransferase n=1 Tax=Pythium oligandrum TaxID=41045 RepID=A0A8K1CTT5_PYTOL|nr:hypothetical protein Poli38472_006135 [Pythium oligandrum]|eukprot:TMW68667.1 hypothetical protein Poli38472_006135 [Pythium oligandrum]
MRSDADPNMREAIEAVTQRGMAIREAARRYGVPRTTLQRKVQRVEVKPTHATTDVKHEDATSATGDASQVMTIAVPSRKRRAEEMAQSPPSPQSPQSPLTPGLASKGPRKAINGKVRMLCHSAGSALDELSNELIMEGKSVFKLGLGQSPFPVPQCIVDELRANAHQRDYLPVAGLPELREDIARWAARALSLPYTREDVLVGPGTKELLFVLQTVYYGDLLLPNPSCTSYAPQANIAGRNMFWLPTYAEDRWVLQPQVLEDHCAKDPEAPRILILNSPSNPTGCVYSEAELQAVAEVARKYRMLIISDEIYSELHHSSQHCSVSKFYPEGTIVSGGLSKWCGAGGWRIGFWLFPSSLDWLKKSMLVMASETYTSVASPIQHAARRAFQLDCIELDAYKGKCCKILKIIGQWCYYQLQKICVDVQEPDGGFYLFPSFARHRKVLNERGIITDYELCQRLLHDTGVAILPGSVFGRDPRELYARIAFVDFKGDIALYLIESMDDFSLDAISGFVQSVCPNLDIAMRKLAVWIANPPMTSALPKSPIPPEPVVISPLASSLVKSGDDLN